MRSIQSNPQREYDIAVQGDHAYLGRTRDVGAPEQFSDSVCLLVEYLIYIPPRLRLWIVPLSGVRWLLLILS